MAKKPTVTTVASGYYGRQALNDNFEALRDAFDNTLSRDGSTPNAMGADLDMNSNDILNVGEIDVQAISIGGVDIYPGNTQIATTYATQNYTGNGSTTTYAMGYNPGSKANVDVYIDGVYQNQDAFNITGTNLTFTAAPPLNSAIEIKVPVNVTSLTNTDSSQIVYNQGGTGAVTTNVKAKLQEFVSVKDFGAVGDGVTDDSAAAKAAMKYASSVGAMLYWPAGTYIISSGVDGTTDSITTLYMSMYGATVKFDVTGGAFNWLANIDDLYIEGGVIGQSDGDLDGGITIRWTTGGAYSMIQLRDVQFQTGGDQSRCIFGDTGNGPTTIDIQNCEFRNFKRGAIESRLDAGLSNAETRAIISGCYFKNMGNSDGYGCSAILLGRNDAMLESIHITNCTFRNIEISGDLVATDVHAVLCYGESVVVDGCHIENISNDYGDDAEAIYVKAGYSRIVNNFIRNGGTSHDGVITAKGKGIDGLDQFSDYCLVANNIIEFDDLDYDAPGIGVQRSHCLVANNILKDLRSARDTLSYSSAMAVGTSQSVTHVTISNNICDGFVNFLGDDSKWAFLTEDIIIQGNNVKNLKGGYGIYYRNDSRVSQGTVDFTASNNSLVQDQTVAYPRTFDPNIFYAGAEIEVSGTASNDGTYTISSWVSEAEIRVTSGISDEAGVTCDIYRTDPGSIKIINNNFHSLSGSFWLRNTGNGKHDLIEVANNTVDGFGYVYRLDTTDGIDTLMVTDNKYLNVGTAIKYGTPVATTSIEGDRSQGTWTPSFANDSFTYDEQVGYYYIVGQQVTLTFYLKFQGTPTANAAQINFPAGIQALDMGTADAAFGARPTRFVNGLLTSANDIILTARNTYIRFRDDTGEVTYDTDEVFNAATGATYSEISGTITFVKNPFT